MEQKMQGLDEAAGDQTVAINLPEPRYASIAIGPLTDAKGLPLVMSESGDVLGTLPGLRASLAHYEGLWRAQLQRQADERRLLPEEIDRVLEAWDAAAA